MDYKSIKDFFEQEYLNADNKRELDYWEPLATFSSNVIEQLRNNNLDKKDIANALNVSVKAIDRWIQLQSIPNYKQFADTAHFLGHRPYMSLYGAFSISLADTYHEDFAAIAKKKNRDPQFLLDELVSQFIEKYIEENKEGSDAGDN